MIFGCVPKDGIFAEAVNMKQYGDIWAIVGSENELANSSRLWHAEATKRMLDLGWIQHSMDPALFLLWEDGYPIGVAGIHVYDMLSTSPRKEHGKKAMADFKSKFNWGACSNDKFVYCGNTVMAFRQEKRIVVNLADFIEATET